MVTKLAVPEIDAEVEYPESDGEPLGETDIHARATVEIFDALRLWFDAEPTTYVAMDNFVYYVPGDNTKSVSPDVYVVKGVGNHARRVYKT
ncbi:MAG: Uma2 family endonuclease, partial [Planctomycetes bacterium]|nr:Uma2 family endonuclease [Planctomycetota bacterium]